MTAPSQHYDTLTNTLTRPMPVWHFPILIQVAAETKDEALAYLAEQGLSDGPAIIEQEIGFRRIARAAILYVNLDEAGSYGETTQPYDVPSRAAEKALDLERKLRPRNLNPNPTRGDA